MPDIGMTGGDKLDAALRNIAARTAGNPEVRVGFLEGATYPDGTSVPLVAAVQEFGAPSRGIPPRPFFRQMIAAKSGAWGGQLGTILKAQNMDAQRSLGLMGEGIKGQLQQSIVDLTSPPLAPETVARKGNAKPLIDTGHMLNSVDYEVSG